MPSNNKVETNSMIRSYVFDCCAIINTPKEFEEITQQEFIQALREHLNKMEEMDEDLDSFGFVDEIEDEE